MTGTDPGAASPAPVHGLRETVEERTAAGKGARNRAPRTVGDARAEPHV
jgi:hypothetical protein